ncbi:MAG: thioredoxin family protein [Xenococcaceae cyanobacterium]
MVLSVSEQIFSKEVLNSSQPVLVHFWAPWCDLCRMINPLLVKFQSEWEGQLKLVRINADQSLKLASTYRLKSLPTLILFERGLVVHRLEGFHERDDLHRTLDAVMISLVAQSA